MNLINIKVPTYSYLRKFAIKRFRSPDGIIRINSMNSDGIVLWRMLHRTPYKNFQRKNLPYNTHINFEISESYASYSGFNISDQNIYIFNRFLKIQFDEFLFHHISINTTSGYSDNIEDQILTFLDYYDIFEDEKSLEGLVKSYQRWRNKSKKLIIS